MLLTMAGRFLGFETRGLPAVFPGICFYFGSLRVLFDDLLCGYFFPLLFQSQQTVLKTALKPRIVFLFGRYCRDQSEQLLVSFYCANIVVCDVKYI